MDETAETQVAIKAQGEEGNLPSSWRVMPGNTRCFYPTTTQDRLILPHRDGTDTDGVKVPLKYKDK